jgi:hypothetical protein
LLQRTERWCNAGIKSKSSVHRCASLRHEPPPFARSRRTPNATPDADLQCSKNGMDSRASGLHRGGINRWLHPLRSHAIEHDVPHRFRRQVPPFMDISRRTSPRAVSLPPRGRRFAVSGEHSTNSRRQFLRRGHGREGRTYLMERNTGMVLGVFQRELHLPPRH